MNLPDHARDRLVVVGRELFATKGYDAASVREITAKARANLGAITYHFGSKQALYHAVLESIAAPLVHAIATASQSPGAPLDRLETVIRAVLRHLAHNPGMPAVLLRELAGDGPLPPPMAAAMKRNLGALLGVIADGQRDGSIRGSDPVLLALSVVAQPFFFTVAARLIREASGLDRDDPAVQERIIDHIATTVRRFVATTPEA